MKKTLLFLLTILFCATILQAQDCQDGPYGIQINDSTVIEATPVDEFEGFKQYLVKAQINQGDVCKLINISCNAIWMVDLNPHSVTAFTGGAEQGQIICNTTGCYDFYIKLKFEADELYIGEGTDCPELPDNPNNPDNPDNPDTPEDSEDPEDPNTPDNPDNPEDPEDPENPNTPDTPYEPGTYATSVPENCPDVMLQAFYWDSNTDNGHGDTRWASLNAQASEIGAYFDLVWLPPSAKSSGGVGYLPSQYSNQNSAWGTRAELEQFITAMHAANTKVIADIVINHANNKSTWCDFHTNDFSPYGVFSPDASWICNTDEVNSDKAAGSCNGKATGSRDDGYGGEANYAAARDWDHNSEKVREMFRAYLKWMKTEMKYDGWRYDYCKGFHGSHINDYNTAAANYFSMTEYWDGNVNVLQSYLNDCKWNTLTLDFATKYDAFNKGIATGNYKGCKGAGLPGAGKSRWAVTFIDSHDSYQRDDNEFCGKGNSMKYPGKILQANAYLLSMPGVPCVFYPHWVKFKDNISKMVLARQAAGVHSQSAVSDEAGDGFYKATITGTNGEIRLLLGPNSGYNTQPDGYTLADKGENYGVYYKTSTPVAPRLIITPGTSTFKDNTTGITVTMKTIAGGENNIIYYTLDDTDPKTSSTRQQYTAPLVIKQTTTMRAYAENGSAQTDVQTYTYTYKEPQTTPIILRFYKPAAWAKVNLYAWSKDAAGKVTELTGKWPGTEMTVQDSEGWYYHQFDATLKEVNFIFNNGTEQTSDLWTDEDVCYSWSGGAEKLEEDCAVTAVEDIEMNEPQHTAQKILIDGQLYIIHSQQKYTILGTPIK